MGCNTNVRRNIALRSNQDNRAADDLQISEHTKLNQEEEEEEEEEDDVLKPLILHFGRRHLVFFATSEHNQHIRGGRSYVDLSITL